MRNTCHSRPKAPRGAWAALAVLGLSVPATAASVPFEFTLISENVTERPGAAYTVTVSDTARAGGTLSSDQVRFTVENTGGLGSVHEIYFDDTNPTKLLNIFDGSNWVSPAMQDSDGAGDAVAYNWGAASPGELPGNTQADPDFVVSVDGGYPLAGDAQGGNAKGLNTASEWLDLTFQLRDGNTFAGIIAAMNSGALRVGLHVGDSTLKNGSTIDSGAWVSCPSAPAPVPLPAPVAAALVLMGGVGATRFRRRRAE